MEGETLVEMFHHLMKADLDRPCLYSKREGIYHPITAKEVKERIQKLALGLQDLGIQKGQKVAILSENRPEWVYLDIAILALGAIDVPIYTSNTPSQIQYILENSESTTVFASGSLIQKVLAIKEELPNVKTIVCLEQPTSEQEKAGVMPISALYKDGDYSQIEKIQIDKDDLATLIYTSGTTGNPKGVMLTHQNFVSNVKVASTALPITKEDRALSFLPLCHVFERTGGYYVMFFNKARIYYAESIEMVSNNLLEVQPTFMCSVPRLYEKIYAKIKEKVDSGSNLKKKIFNWGSKVGKEANQKFEQNAPLNFGLKLKYKIADKFVFSKLREKTGGHLRYFISGGAPLSPIIAEFFASAGIIILEGYGLTETSPIITCNLPNLRRIGTVGPPIPGVEVKIAEDGEILAKGPNIMKGYYQNEAATTEVLDSDGWFHTGDIGEFDKDGFLKITDRKKDILVTSGGKNVAPQNLENLYKTDAFIAELVVIGDQKKFCAALVVPEFHKLANWAKETGIEDLSHKALAANPKVNEFLLNRIENLSQNLAQFEKIKKICVLENEFSVESGELTPTLKVKRKVINKKYREEIDSLYPQGT